jgi:hypothetical protein
MNTDTLTTTATSPRPPAGPARRPRPAWHWPAFGLAAVLGLYLVGRGIAEFFTLHWGDPASYASDWGGPSVAGVLAVHSGPGLAVLVGTAWWLARAWRRQPAGPGAAR